MIAVTVLLPACRVHRSNCRSLLERRKFSCQVSGSSPASCISRQGSRANAMSCASMADVPECGSDGHPSLWVRSERPEYDGAEFEVLRADEHVDLRGLLKLPGDPGQKLDRATQLADRREG